MKRFIKRYMYNIISTVIALTISFSILISGLIPAENLFKGITLMCSSFIPGSFNLLWSGMKRETGTVVVPSRETGTVFENNKVSQMLGVPTETWDIPAENAGAINEVQYKATAGGITIQFGGGFIKNSTNHSNEEVMSIISQKPNIPLKLDGTVEVLILHTHATECYNPHDSGTFDKTLPSRSNNNSENMVAVGDVLYEELKKLGVGVVHCEAQHDVTFTGAYNREAESVAEYIEKYPDIKIIIDLHRDAIEPDENTRVKPTAVINGKKAAQIMILSGCENGNMNFPNWAENLRLNALLEDKIETTYPGLTKPVYFNYSKYNQNLSTGATLIEIGSHANTLEEAKYSAYLLAQPIYMALYELKA